jgi:predicted DNA-binding transcriptional regulator YafY
MRLASRPPLARITVIDRELRAGAWPNAGTLARLLEVSPRTVQRDFLFLRDRLHAPVCFDPHHNGYRYTDATYRLPLFQLSEGELVAVFLAERLLQEYRGTPYGPALASAFRKIADNLPDEVSLDLNQLGAGVFFRQRSLGPADVEIFTKVQQAVRRGRQLELLYWTASRDETCRRRVDPYHVGAIDGDWYLIGYCHLREDVRMFALARIREVEETGETCERPPGFKLADYLDAGFRKFRGKGRPKTVRLRFHPAAARYVREKAWHPSQKLVPLEDGGLEMTFQVTHLLEVRRWVLSWGQECVVLEPAQLRRAVLADLKNAAKHYRRTPAKRKRKRDDDGARYERLW